MLTVFKPAQKAQNANTEQIRGLLDILKLKFERDAQKFPAALQWKSEIEELIATYDQPATTICVAGTTGAGKSSLINAVLDEENLLPTSSIRACTSAPIEISFSTDHIPYRAEVDFMIKEELSDELEKLFGDAFDTEDDTPFDINQVDPDSEAGIAFAKLRAIYPQRSLSDLQKSNVKEVIRDFEQLLGTTLEIQAPNRLDFRNKLNPYLMNRLSKLAKFSADQHPSTMSTDSALWAIVKVVRVYVQSACLSTGATLVDIPGTQDANAARSNIANDYIKNSENIWVVAPIKRAVDDKVAQNLLGKQFKRQLEMDGKTVSFICSQIDDINCDEVIEALGLEEEMSHLDEKRKQLLLQKVDLVRRIEAMEPQQTTGVSHDTMLNREFEASERMGHKRKFKTQDSSVMKRICARLDYHIHENAVIPVNEVVDTVASDSEMQLALVLRPRHLSRDVPALVGEFNEDTHSETAGSELHDLENRLRQLECEISILEGGVEGICIAERSAYCTSEIQRQYAEGDETLGDEHDTEELTDERPAPSQDTVPVFCISSRAYQRFSKGTQLPGFKSAEQTGIPQLRSHCQEKARAHESLKLKTFLNGFEHLITSLSTWSSQDEVVGDARIDPSHRIELLAALEGVQKNLKSAAQAFIESFSSLIDRNIYCKFKKATSAAEKVAMRTALKWGAPFHVSSPRSGGVRQPTYKAICRHKGVFQSKWGHYNWNSELLEPMMEIIGRAWLKTFIADLKAIVRSFQNTALLYYQSFSDLVVKKARELHEDDPYWRSLPRYDHTFESRIRGIAQSIESFVRSKQKDMSRRFMPTFQMKMAEVYTDCVEIKGRGCFKAMKERMILFIDTSKDTIFQECTSVVRTELEGLIRETRNKTQIKIQLLGSHIQRDYRFIGEMNDTSKEEAADTHASKEWRRTFQGLIARGKALLDECKTATEHEK